MTIFTIREFRRNRFDVERCPDDQHPEALYDWSVSREGSSWVISSGGVFSKYEPLLAYLGVENLQCLEGRHVQVPDELNPSIDNALELLVLIARNGGSYIRLSREDIVEMILNALAVVPQAPNFSGSDMDGESVYFAAHSIFYEDHEDFGMRMSDDRLHWLESEMIRRSGGNIVSVRRLNPDEFPCRVKGVAEYLQVNKENRMVKITFGPYSCPITVCS